VSVRTIITLALVVALAAGAWWHGERRYQAGYAAREAVLVRDQLKSADKAIENTKANVAESREIDKAVQARQAAELAAAKDRASRLEKALAQQERTPYQPPTLEANHEAKKPLLGQSVLDVFTLCLLNAERAGIEQPGSACAAGRADEEIAAAAATPTEVGGGDLARADQELSAQYRDLATRHDGLVDWVEEHIINGKN